MSGKTPTGIDFGVDEEVRWHGRRSLGSMGGLIAGLGLGVFVYFNVYPILYFFIYGVPSELSFYDNLYVNLYLDLNPLNIFFFVVFSIGIILIIAKVLATEYVITDKRVSSRYGLVVRKTNEAAFEKIQGTSLNQGLFGRLLGHGDVGVRTAGTAGTEINFKGVSEPKQVQKMLRDMIDRHEEDKEADERIKKFEDKYMMGQITKEEFDEAKRDLKENINREDEVVTPSDTSSTTTPTPSGISKDEGERASYQETSENAPNEQQEASQTPAEKVEELKKLKEDGLISEEEFKRKKDEILDRL